MRAALLLTALSCSCVDAHGTAVADLAIDDGSAPVMYSCAQRVADYCARHGDCVGDLTTAETTPWCANMRAAFAYYTTCDGYVVVWASGIDSGAGYVYDAATGALAAIVWYSNAQGGCLAGPMTFDVQGCRGETRICPTSP